MTLWCLVFGLFVVVVSGDTFPELDGKIVGGFDASIEQFPYQVSVQFLQTHICGGAIIHPRYVITAAHCTDGAQANYMQIRTGSSAHAYGGRLINVLRIHQHPSYNQETVNYDLSLLELEEPIQYGISSRNVQLPYYGFIAPDGANSVVSGWGFSQEAGSVSRTLQAVFLPIVNKNRCRQSYDKYVITENMLCAGILDVGMKDTCQGDSGGPLIYEGRIIGIVSWGYGCARPKFPGVYTDVAKLRSFIDRTIHN